MDISSNVIPKLIFNLGNKRAKRKRLHETICVTQALPMEGQVGGLSKTKNRILSTSNNYLLKSLQNDNRGLREVAFYEMVSTIKAIRDVYDSNNTAKCIAIGKKSVEDDNGFRQLYEIWLFEASRFFFRRWQSELNQLHELCRFLPEYYGLLMSSNDDSGITHASNQENRFMVLTDETRNFTKPCIIDLKVGTKTYEPDSSPYKIEKQTRKYPQQEEFGFRVVGMQVYDPHHDEANSAGFRHMDKVEGRNLSNRNDVKNTLQMFFKVTNACEKNEEVVAHFIEELEILKKWFYANKTFGFYASSLLLVYEGSDKPRDSNGKLKMIDFAHVTKNKDQDKGYIHGIEQISQLLKELLNRI